jgi:branched-chain amino acid transport system substrate-binding protein
VSAGRPTLRRAAAVAALAIVTALGAAAGDAGSRTKPPFKVLMVQDLSGPLASLGQAEVRGMQASAAIVNARGGIFGRRVRVDAVDDQSDPTKAASLLIDRISSGNVPDFVQGGTGSNETLAMLPILTEHKILYFGQNGATQINDPARYPYAFSLALLPNVMGAVLARHLTLQGFHKVGIMVSNTASGQSQMPDIEAAINNAGISTTAQSFDPTSLDMSPQLDALKAQNPDALVTVNAFGRAALTLLQSRQKLGWMIPTVGDTALAAQDLVGGVGAAAVANVFYAVSPIQRWVPPAKRSKAFKTFLTALKAQGPITTSLNVYSQAYDELQILQVAAAQARSTSVPKLAAALAQLKRPAAAAVPWVTYPHVVFTKTSHFQSGPPTEEAVVIPAGPIVDGMFVKL